MASKEVKFETMEGFHKLKSLWRIDYKIKTLEPLLTQASAEEAKEVVDSVLGKNIAKDLPDAVPLIIDGKAVVTGNSVKGVFRHIISSQLREAGIPICFQKVKGDSVASSDMNGCSPPEPCFSCTWFGTTSRQGALYFSILKNQEPLEKILLDYPMPMIALRDDYRAAEKRSFLLLAPIKEDTDFCGWITGENLSCEILGAIKEVQDMSEKGFLKFGGFKTRGFGSVKIEINKIEKYKTVPFGLETTYTDGGLKEFLGECQRKYHNLIDRGKQK